MNPFEQKSKTVDQCIVDWKLLTSKPYNKNDTDPYTKIRIILMNGTEFEAVWFSHQFHRHCADNELRRELALMRRIEQQQQKRISSLKPRSESILETTIGYEMLAVDLTIALAKNEKSPLVKKALDFALLEDFDHLYRYSDLLENEHGIHAERLVGKYVEIMPGRPTISHHRHPFDDVKPHISADDSLQTKLNVGIITAAEQQTMNYYMNVGSFYESEQGRRLYNEIAMVEEEHVTQYGGLKDPSVDWLECLLMHEYTECYLYYSNFKSEQDEQVKKLWEQLFEQEVAHLHKAEELLERFGKKEREQIIPDGKFPTLLQLEPSKEYLRKVLKSASLTAKLDDYIEVDKLPQSDPFFEYQNAVNGEIDDVASHSVIKNYIKKNGKDYRYQEDEHPVPVLRDRERDNISLGRLQEKKEDCGE